MSVLASVVLADILNRIRATDATMVSNVTPPTTADGQAFVFAQITSAQMFVNLAEHNIVTTANFTPTANVVLYLLSTILPDAITILDVRVTGTGPLDGPCDWHGFAGNSLTWLTDTGTAYVAWSQIGKDILAIVPAMAVPVQVVIRYINQLTTITTGGQSMQVPDDTVEHVTRLAELICRIKTRQLQGFQDRLQTLAETMQIEIQTNDSANPRGQ